MKKGIEMDYGKPDRHLFLEKSKQEAKWDKINNWLFLALILFFGYHLTRFFLN